MKKAIYRVTEVNVDGCGGDATEFVAFSHRLSERETELFKEALKNAKNNGEDDLDTADMIQEALDAMAGEEIIGKLCFAPYEGSIEF